jgi:hypothetical protein
MDSGMGTRRDSRGGPFSPAQGYAPSTYTADAKTSSNSNHNDPSSRSSSFTAAGSKAATGSGTVSVTDDPEVNEDIKAFYEAREELLKRRGAK